MKRLNYWMMAAMLCVPMVRMQALTLPEDEPVVVYYMPQTQLLFTVEYDEVVTEVGPFYQYSARYLGTKDVQTKAEKQFVLNNVTFMPMAAADTSRSYVLQDKSGKTQMVSLSPWGTLEGYNLAVSNQPSAISHQHQPCKSGCECLVGTETTNLMPLLEEQLMASSTAKMAEGAAKQIYRIREMRLNLLAGDVEKYPSDGEALKRVLAEMDKREQELTALFIGRRIVTHHVHHVTYIPAANGKKADGILFRFSKYYGIVANDDLSGEPVKIQISKSAHQLFTPEKSNKQSAPTLYYNLPGSGEMKVQYGEQVLVDHPVEVAQWGVSVPLNSALLNASTKITFNPITGNIISIDK
ncbi:MAG: DUF4831 family protein [Paludibacteraceae bacterium]|nr:DUF4831 family protein [Paludibacteraceae bacterium]